MSKIVVLDAGHGGKDAGAVNGNRYEKNDVLKLVIEVERLLKKQKGVSVHLTREKDIYTELYSRSVFSNNRKADAFVSIHRNSFASSSAKGTEIWVHPLAPSGATALASGILERLIKTGIQSNRGIKKGAYAVLTAKAPAIMLELGFISNKADNTLFDDNLGKYAQDIAQGIYEFLGVEYNGSSTKPLYRVQVGAFSSEDNARRFLEEVKGKGLDAYLVVPSLERVEKE